MRQYYSRILTACVVEIERVNPEIESRRKTK